jgi:pantoate--beta-alanine ligase
LIQDVVISETLREADGLAMSSRNVYLSAGNRRVANMLYNAMKVGENAVNNGCYERAEIFYRMDVFLEQLNMHAQYWSIAHPRDLSEIEIIDPKVGAILSGSMLIGNTRIIDNILLGVDYAKI